MRLERSALAGSINARPDDMYVVVLWTVRTTIGRYYLGQGCRTLPRGIFRTYSYIGPLPAELLCCH